MNGVLIALVIACALLGIAGIVHLESMAIRAGMDGTALSAAIASIAAIISGLGGWLIPAPWKRRNK